MVGLIASANNKESSVILSPRPRWAVKFAFLIAINSMVGTAVAAPKNVVFILSDDHRYDFMGFMPESPDFLQTPSLDKMAREGMHLKNAFVTTSLCSPSRASILTGRYAHHHGIVDNTSPIPEGTTFFPADLQRAGYQTAFIGKWHMGEVDDLPQPGFDRWVSFRGQGRYRDPLLNVDGKKIQHEGYTTDLLTDYAIDWLKERESDQPFFLYLSHKAVHAEFQPAERHDGQYEQVKIPYPDSMDNNERNYVGKPAWVRAQRDSWHGVDYAYHGDLQFDEFYRDYAETLLGVDESVGRVMTYLEEHDLAEDTLVIYMGDNGFLLGEHGLIDKRNAYEESIRVPMLAWAPGTIAANHASEKLVRNIDVAPTILALAGAETDVAMDGESFLPLLEGSETLGDREFLYEYYWEHAFPHTPTTFALRGGRYKYIYYHGIWDKNELYDLKTDPREQHNLIDLPAFKQIKDRMHQALFDRLQKDDAMRVPIRRGTWQAAERLLD
ncbi:sulfatase [Microbulbifer magnicolonia]|uniref:sulfatase family protein n=1 Tax=Microbulbifer magnicolonia TaxID=3109744 RepID=UPI002B4182F7|nr:sulfatase [Microbulbifer sp. GG15]